MKSLLTKIISVLTICVLCVGLCACGTPLNEEKCVNGHSLAQTSYTAPTCKTNGQKVSKCSRCDYTETETLLPIDHNYEIKTTIPSTCSTHGSTSYECSMCYDRKTSTLPLLNHNYKLIEETPSTCTVKGTKKYKCEDCSDIYSTELELLPHAYEIVNTATCFTNGELKNVCAECGNEEVVESTEMLTHDFGVDGYCTKCGIYETLFDEDELNVTWKPYQNGDRSHIFDDIHGYLSPKFNNENHIPDEYFVEHTIYLDLSFYDNNNNFLENKKFSSFIIPWDGFGCLGKPTIQYGGSTNGFAYEFMLRFWLQKAFEEKTLSNATSFKIELSCQGYKTIEKTYQITEAQ